MYAIERKKYELKKIICMDGLILDVGCGSGLFAGENIIKIDLITKNFNSFLLADVQYLPFRENTFDNVLLLDVLEHIQDDECALYEIHRVLKVGGSLVATTPCTDGGFMRIKIPTKVKDSELWKEWGHIRIGYSVQEITRKMYLFKIDYLRRYYSTFAIFGSDLYYGRKWHILWDKIYFFKLFLKMLIMLDVVFSRNKGCGIIIKCIKMKGN